MTGLNQVIGWFVFKSFQKISQKNHKSVEKNHNKITKLKKKITIKSQNIRKTSGKHQENITDIEQEDGHARDEVQEFESEKGYP